VSVGGFRFKSAWYAQRVTREIIPLFKSAVAYALLKVDSHNCFNSWLLVTLDAGMREPSLNTTETWLSSVGSTIPYTSIMPSRSPSGALIVMLLIIRYKFGIKLWSDFGIELITDLTVHTRWLGWYKLFDMLPKVNWYIDSCPGLGVILPGKLGADINFQSPKMSDEYADLTVGFKAANTPIAFIISGCDVSPKCF